MPTDKGHTPPPSTAKPKSGPSSLGDKVGRGERYKLIGEMSRDPHNARTRPKLQEKTTPGKEHD